MSLRVNEIFYSLQGEGLRAGEASIFVRFAGCNQSCTFDTVGFNCDTDHGTFERIEQYELVRRLSNLKRQSRCRWIVLTGGEPGLQLTQALVDDLHDDGFFLAVETNGTVELPVHIDWVALSPKTPEDQLAVLKADEVKIVVKAWDPLPKFKKLQSLNWLVSPAFEDTFRKGYLPDANLRHAIQLCMDNPTWRLSVQQHKLWKIR